MTVSIVLRTCNVTMYSFNLDLMFVRVKPDRQSLIVRVTDGGRSNLYGS